MVHKEIVPKLPRVRLCRGAEGVLSSKTQTSATVRSGTPATMQGTGLDSWPSGLLRRRERAPLRVGSIDGTLATNTKGRGPSIHALPDEILLTIFRFLRKDFRAVVVASHVCSRVRM